eukprot:tig00021761_g23451.t1
MQSRSNGVRTAAANLTSLERERRSKSAAQGGGRPLVAKSARPGRRRQVFLLLVGSRKKEKAAADAKQGNGASGAGAVLGRVALDGRGLGVLVLAALGRRCGSFGIAVEGCRTAGRGASRLLLTHLLCAASAINASPFGQRSALSSHGVGARPQRALCLRVGHGQGMLDAEERDCYLSSVAQTSLASHFSL